MFEFIKKKIEKIKSKRSLHEYGFEINTFTLASDGKIDYAQWLHPYESKKEITEEMVQFYASFAPKGSMIIDIGAHTGDTAVPMAIAVGKTGSVLALEPNPYVFKILVENASLNTDKTNIIPLNFAATDEDGSFEFNYSDASFCNGGFLQKIENKNHGHKYTLQVQGKNFQNYLEKHYKDQLASLSLVKVDAEGYDKNILRSIRPILAQYQPHIISECNQNLTPGERTELFDLINGLGYDIFKLDGFEDAKAKTLISSASQMNQWRHFDLVAIAKK
ncbi:MAG: FkbM family methyltransferase [Chitinophagales bacterium]|nr:FkbM family methyltransferase [Chitinophagales bacterium]